MKATYYELHREEVKAKNRAYYYANHERVRERVKKTSKARYKRVRGEVFDKLGRSCVWCGFSDIRALHFDHKYGGGRQHRLRFGSNYAGYYQDILKALDDFQVLCANCNTIKMYENGEHPSEK